MISNDKIVAILQENPNAEISTVASKLIESGYQHPIPEEDKRKRDGERINPFITDLSATLTKMTQDGLIAENTEDGKSRYSVK